MLPGDFATASILESKTLEPDSGGEQADIEVASTTPSINSVATPLIAVPGIWNSFMEGFAQDGRGIGTYRLRLILPERDLNRDLTLYFPEIEMPMRVFFNGEELIEYGKVRSSSTVDDKLVIRKKIKPLALQRENEILVQVSNFKHRYQGGLNSAPELVNIQWLSSHYEVQTMLHIFFFTVFFMLSFIALLLFLIRRRENFHLLFAITAGIYTVYTILSFDGGLLSLITRVDHYMMLRLMRTFQILAFGALLIFSQSIHKRIFSEWFQYGVASLTFVLATVTLVLPLQLVDRWFFVNYFLFNGFILIILFNILLHIRSRKKGVLVTFFSLWLPAASAVYFTLNYYGIGAGLDILMDLSVLLFLVVHLALIFTLMNDMYVGKERLKRENINVQRRGHTDSLTSLPNRKRFESIIQYYWDYCYNEDKYLTIGFVDIDCFSQFNEHYGNVMGDACLKRVAHSLNKTLRRPEDFIGRYEGQRFIFVLPDTNVANGKAASERIRADVERAAIEHKGIGDAGRVTVSIGAVSFSPIDSVAMANALKGARQALNKAKNGGRNQVKLFLMKKQA